MDIAQIIDSAATLLLLIGLELVLGIDNILVITILVSKLPEELKNKARIIGLALAMGARVAMLFLIFYLTQMEEPLFSVGTHDFSIKDLILIAGGLFLLWKAVSEIHHTVELKEGEEEHSTGKMVTSFGKAVTQIVLLDIVFSIDSVLTAVGLTENNYVIIAAVIVSFSVILFFAKPVGDFILKHVALKILALSFLVTIGITLCMEGMHQHVVKAYIYMPMGFALTVELLQMRYAHNKKTGKTP